MQFPRWLKIIYWIVLVGLLTWLLWYRVDDARSGRATPVDALLFVVWLALVLAPVFSEVELLGVKLKQEVEKAKAELSRDIASLRADISSAIDVRANISPNIYLAPPADSQLPALEAQIKKAVDQAIASRPNGPSSLPAGVRPVDDDIIFLFRTRRDLEIELGRIVRERQLQITTAGRPLVGIQLARILGQAEVLEPDLVKAIREVYSICSLAIHGENVSEDQVAFVRDLGPSILQVLRATI